MALLEEQFTETLDAGAPDITYKGNEGQEQKIARELWDQLPPEAQQQFGNFQQFFSSGAWKQVLQMLQEKMQQGQQMPQQPQQGLGAMMPAQMAEGGVPEEVISLMEGIRTPRGEEVIDDTMTLASDPGMGEGPFMLEEFLQAVKDGYKGSYEDFINDIDRSPADYLAYGGVAGADGRRAYGLGSIFKKITKPIKKLIKSPVGKAAAIAGLGSWGLGMGPLGNLAGAGWMKGPMMKKLLLKAPAEGKTVADLSWSLGNLSPLKVLGAGATVAPLAMQAAGKWDTGEQEIDSLKAKAAEFGFDYSQMIQDLQAAVATGSEAELAKVLSNYNLSRGDMSAAPYIGTAAQGGRIGAQEGGLMSLGGMEMDLRGGGFVPLGAKEKADDVPARLSKNEFVFTADAVRAAGGGDVDAGADKMYNTMKQLEGRVG